MAQTVKCLTAMRAMWVQSLGQEDPLEKKMATHSSILAWRFLWTEEPGGLQSMGRKESDTTEETHTQSCLENPMDRGAWQAMVHTLAKSWTRLKHLSTHACIQEIYCL